MPASLLVYLIALLPTRFTRVRASTDIVSQLYYNSNFTAPTTPSKLNTQLTELVNTVTNFTTLPNNLQRALLWSAGWVQAAPGYADSSSSSSSATADYVQVYVLCGRSMSDTFQASLTFDNETACALMSCKANVITYTESTCDPSYVATTAHCALSLDVNVPFKQSDGPMWSTVGDIDIDSFDPQLFQYSASDADTTLYMLAEKSKWSMSDDTCPNSAIFIAPCIQVEPENVGDDAQVATWCEPEIELSVRSWLQEIAATNTSKTDNRVENLSSGGISTGAIAGIIAACVVVVLVFGFVIARRRHSGGTQNQGQTGLWDDDVITANRIPREKVSVNELVSRGAFGEVYTGVFNDQRVAIKMLLPSTRRDIKLVNDFLAEAKLTASMDHPRIVTCIGVAWDSLSDLCVVMEFMEGGDLRTLLSNYEKTGHPVGFNREKVAIALHVCHALTYLHSLEPSVIHRDLKSRNILLNDANEAKLTDFGISRERLDRTMTAGVGTSLWMAPEVMTGERYDEKADMFSFGVVLSELDSHTLPYAQAKQEMQQSHGRQMTDATLLQKVAMGTVSVEFSDAAPRSMVDLGCACVSVDPTLRPSAAEALFKLQVILSKELAN